MFFIVRGLSAVWGLIFTYIYGENGEGFTIAAFCMIALLTISLVVGFIGCPKTRCRSLEDITRERYGDIVDNDNSNSPYSIGLCIFSFLIPFGGLILFLMKKDENKKAADAYAKSACIGLGVDFILTILLLL